MDPYFLVMPIGVAFKMPSPTIMHQIAKKYLNNMELCVMYGTVFNKIFILVFVVQYMIRQ